MSEKFRIYKNSRIVSEGESPLKISGLQSKTTIPAGEYQVTRISNGYESKRTDIPEFTTGSILVDPYVVGGKWITGTFDGIQATKQAIYLNGERQDLVGIDSESLSAKRFKYYRDGLTIDDNVQIALYNNEYIELGKVEVTIQESS